MRASRLRRRAIEVAVAITALCCFAVGTAASKPASTEFIVIVNRDNPATEVDKDFVRDAFLKKTTTWNGETLRPIDLAAKSEVREKFTTEIIRKTPSQLRSYWDQQIFSGKGVPPPETDSVSAVVAYVVANKGAIGYVPADADTGGAKVIKVE
jgi:ABC-type phosphate transport system substrate-binding protein